MPSRSANSVQHHENSETVQRESDGRWINIYGEGTGKNKGKKLPISGDWATVEEAERAAKERSVKRHPKGGGGGNSW